ncbi:Beta-lactamase-like protein [Minicystis rosea]|nr:Beta-lactamase-like protein [Minicystis rosea]
MKTIRAALLAALALSTVAVAACQPFRVTHHAVAPAAIGVARSSVDLAAVTDEPGPVTVETVVGADWEIDRSGLINLEHPKAVAAGLKDGPEPIIIPFHAVRHPTQGLFLVDTGVERALRDQPDQAAIRGLAASVMHVDKMRFRTDTASWVAAQKEPVKGVFLTHLHVDHISGMRDVPASAVVYTGPGETTESSFQNLFVGPITDSALAGKGPIRELRFTPDAGGDFDGVLDVFGDGSFWALWVPGHTPGSTAYLARTPEGPVLMVGDACHTAWGWEHGVEPGTFSHDRKKSVDSLARLQRFVAKHPRISVRLGHQLLAQKGAPSVSAR